ncbi:uncharacterized protein BJ212DRAFT_1375085 [Suillus subaureus]|uniref:Uncharacterized protein n=1 Tax=Suillus subaureus TaxID=48587 RepID=A0A9P7JAK7_9AGAM|nr:uncharacterized protein BJ212DRAFT_1375085 [Suillus subaureus]KAG1811129.1 hypothetical protein BJ212DRAFT_1375085 [Suillus subaureus]
MHSRCTQPAMLLNDTRTIFMLLVALWVVRLVLMPFISGTTFGGDTLDSTFKQLLNRCDSFFPILCLFNMRLFGTVPVPYLVLEHYDFG